VKGGATAESAGVITTPAVAFLTRSEGFDAGLVLSASHNPYRDNGIKVFTAAGSKSSADLEARIARDVAQNEEVPEAREKPRLADPDPRLEELYLDHLLSASSRARTRLPKLEIALGCANGAGYASVAAPERARLLVIRFRGAGRRTSTTSAARPADALSRGGRRGCDLGAASTATAIGS
jgi:phosphoglucosamine mutase